MGTTTPSAHDWKEWRRLRAWELKQQGWVQQDIAAALDVSKETVSRWLHRAHDGGVAALLSHPAPGPLPKLTPAQPSVMGGMTPLGKVYTLVRQESLNGLHSIEFLTHLLHVAGRRLLVSWDGSPIHRRVAVKEFVSGTGGQVWLEGLPGYAPD